MTAAVEDFKAWLTGQPEASAETTTETPVEDPPAFSWDAPINPATGGSGLDLGGASFEVTPPSPREAFRRWVTSW